MIQPKRLFKRVAVFALPAMLAAASLYAAKTEILETTNRTDTTFAAMVDTTDSVPTLYERLCTLNSNWSGKTPDSTDIAKVGDMKDEVSLIQGHLALVIERLKSADVRHLTNSQRDQRAKNILRLHDYMNEGIFPQNIFVPGRRPVFIDPWGTHCAVGHLIASSGHPELAQLINEEHRLDVLRDIKTEGLSGWQMASGLNIHELALIQPTYAFRSYSETVSYPSEIESLILGDSHDVMEALENGKLGVESRCGGKTLLHFAAAAGDLELVKYLVERGADLNAVSTRGCDDAEIAKGGNNRIAEVRWEATTRVTPGEHTRNLGRVYETPSGSYIADVLQDAFGGMDGKNALEFAIAKPRPASYRYRSYRSRVPAYGLKVGQPGTSSDPVDSLKKARAKVADWLQEQGLK